MTEGRWILAFPVSADNLGYTKDNPLFFSIDLDYAPLQMVDMRGEPHGLDLDFTKVLMNRLDIPFEYKPDNWETIVDDVVNNRVGLAMMLYSPNRKNLTNYSQAVFSIFCQSDMAIIFPLTELLCKNTTIYRYNRIFLLFFAQFIPNYY